MVVVHRSTRGTPIHQSTTGPAGYTRRSWVQQSSARGTAGCPPGVRHETCQGYSRRSPRGAPIRRGQLRQVPIINAAPPCCPMQHVTSLLSHASPHHPRQGNGNPPGVQQEVPRTPGGPGHSNPSARGTAGGPPGERQPARGTAGGPKNTKRSRSQQEARQGNSNPPGVQQEVQQDYSNSPGVQHKVEQGSQGSTAESAGAVAAESATAGSV